jgi:hypothetical protein
LSGVGAGVLMVYCTVLYITWLIVSLINRMPTLPVLLGLLWMLDHCERESTRAGRRLWRQVECPSGTHDSE